MRALPSRMQCHCARTPLTLRLAAIVAFLLITIVPLRSQTGDIKLSVDPVQMVLPLDAQIQSAARIGDTTLVVWGSTKLVGEEVRNVLWMQMLVDTTPVGEKKIITSEEARPYGFVQVLELGQGFLVVWKGRKGDVSGMYSIHVNLEGTVVSEGLLTDKPVRAEFYSASLANGSLVLWSDTSTSDSRIYARVMGDNGEWRGQEYVLDSGRIEEVITNPQRSSLTVILRWERIPLLVDTAGSKVEPSSDFVQRFANPYYVDAQGGLISTELDTLNIYRWPTDSLPIRSVALPVKGRLVFPTLDTVGRISVVWCNEYIRRQFSGGAAAIFELPILMSTEINPGVLSEGSTVGSIEVHATPRYVVGTSLMEGSNAVRLCGNRYRASYLLYHNLRWEGPDGNGSEERHFTRTVLFNGSTFVSWPLPSSITSCFGDRIRYVDRVLSKFSSTVRVTAAGTPIYLSAPVAMVVENVPDRRPALQSASTGVLMGSACQGVDSMFILALWSNATVPTPIDSLSTNMGTDVPSDRSPIRERDELGIGSGLFYAASYARWSEPLLPAARDTQRCVVHVPTISGWRLAFTRRFGHIPRALTVMSAAIDHTSGDHVFLLGATVDDHQPSQMKAIAVDINASVSWDVDTARIAPRAWNAPILPLWRNNYFIVGLEWGRFGFEQLTRMQGDQSLRVMNFTSPADSRYLLLPDRRILCWNNQALVLRDTNAQVLDSIPITLPAGVVDSYMLPNAAGTRFALVVGGSDGVSALLLDSRPRLIKTIQVSATRDSVAHPTAAFLGDTLYVAWEDYRNGVSDIYGAIVTPEQMKVGVEDEAVAGAADAITIAPTPSRDRAVITLPSSMSGEATIEVIDNLGERRVMVTTREREVVLDTSTLPSGVYSVRVSDGVGARTARLVVAH